MEVKVICIGMICTKTGFETEAQGNLEIAYFAGFLCPFLVSSVILYFIRIEELFLNTLLCSFTSFAVESTCEILVNTLNQDH